MSKEMMNVEVGERKTQIYIDQKRRGMEFSDMRNLRVTYLAATMFGFARGSAYAHLRFRVSAAVNS